MEATSGTHLASHPLIVPGAVGQLWATVAGYDALRNWLHLIVFGGMLGICRRTMTHLWMTIVAFFFVTAHFEGNDASYDWMIAWLEQHPAWKKARQVQVSTRRFSTSPLILEGEEEAKPVHLRKLAFLPTFGSKNVLYFHGHRMSVSRNQRYLADGSSQESLTVRILTRSQFPLSQLLLEARNAYMEGVNQSVTVYCPDSYNIWRPVRRCAKRPLSSVILEEDVKKYVLDDAREFLASETWYSERGIPFRRGYLLHGAPGTGKTSLINSISGELSLDIYVVRLSKRGLDDNILSQLIADIPANAIALMEDIDAAFTHNVQRSSASPSASIEQSEAGARVSLSGLLNAIDGVSAQEGRLLFATTNHIERLDPALSRPGRMDVHVQFGLASTWQATALFKAFYQPTFGDDLAAQIPGEKPPADPMADASETIAVLSSSTTPPLGSTPVSDTGIGSNASIGEACALSNSGLRPPRLPPCVLDELAARFGAALPAGEFTMAALQGHLMCFKTRPFEAVTAIVGFVQRERAAAQRNVQITLIDVPGTRNERG